MKLYQLDIKMQLLFKHLWLFYMFVTYFLGWRIMIQSYKHPLLKEGYRLMAKNWVLYGSIPWLIVGMGQAVGSTQTIFEYCYPSSFNPFIVVFHLVIFTLLTVYWHWLMFREGAEFMEKHPLGRNIVAANEAKFIASLLYVKLVIVTILTWINVIYTY